jgi:hypothetical protein
MFLKILIYSSNIKRVKNNPRAANFFWSGELTFYELSNLLSFKKNGFEVIVWSYEDLNLPKGILRKDASEIISQNYLTSFNQNFQKQNLSSFSNLFRYELLKKYGGWWFDSDCICLKPVEDFVKLTINRPFVLAYENPELIGSSAMYINDMEIVDSLRAEIYKRIDKNNFKFFWGEIGPNLITDVFAEKNIFNMVLSSNTFFPVPPSSIKLFFLSKDYPFLLEKISESYICHTWNEMFRRYNISKNILPPKNSFLDNYIKEFYPELKNRRYSKFMRIRFNVVIQYLFKGISRIKTFTKYAN